MIIRKGEEDDCERQPADGDRVDDNARHPAHVEGAAVHVLAPAEEVREDRHHVGAVVDGDCGAQERVERCRGTEVQTAERGNNGSDGQLSIERGLKGRVDF